MLVTATDVFSQIDPTFKGYTAIGAATPKTELVVYELLKDATFSQMFEWLTKKRGKSLDELCFTQHQIRRLAKQCPHLLKSSGATFVLFKCGKQYCVALISAKQDETLTLDLRLLDFYIEWLAEFSPHIIIPK